jgi:hypothetical protein
MVLAAVAGSVMLAAPPAIAATEGAHSGVTTFDKRGTCPTPPAGSQNFGDELALTYDGQGTLTEPAPLVVDVHFETGYAFQGPPGIYTNSTCSTVGGSATVTVATISDAVGMGSCQFTGGSYTRSATNLLPETVTFTGGTCSGTLAGGSTSVTNVGTSACVPGFPQQTYPLACTSTWTINVP